MRVLLPPDAHVPAPIRLPPTTRARSTARSSAPLARRPRQAALALRCPHACGVPRRRGVHAVRGAGVTPSRCHGPAGRSSSTGTYSSHTSSDRRAPPFASMIHAPPNSWPHRSTPFLPLPWCAGREGDPNSQVPYSLHHAHRHTPIGVLLPPRPSHHRPHNPHRRPHNPRPSPRGPHDPSTRTAATTTTMACGGLHVRALLPNLLPPASASHAMKVSCSYAQVDVGLSDNRYARGLCPVAHPLVRISIHLVVWFFSAPFLSHCLVCLLLFCFVRKSRLLRQMHRLAMLCVIFSLLWALESKCFSCVCCLPPSSSLWICFLCVVVLIIPI
jgi:hypothetical protein